jgi:hypothetical protein
LLQGRVRACAKGRPLLQARVRLCGKGGPFTQGHARRWVEVWSLDGAPLVVGRGV